MYKWTKSAKELFASEKEISASLLQSKLRVGYPTAAVVVAALYDAGMLTDSGNKKRSSKKSSSKKLQMVFQIVP